MARHESAYRMRADGKTLREIGEALGGVTRERARQLVNAYVKRTGAPRLDGLEPVDGLHPRIAKYIVPEPNTGCWLFTGTWCDQGYGRYVLSIGRGPVHRYVYQTLKGEIPEGLQLDHKCRVRCCCNPDHLEPVTPRENVRRGIIAQVNRARFAARTHCKNGHLLSEDTRIYSGRKFCGKCLIRNSKKANAIRSHRRFFARLAGGLQLHEKECK